MNVDLITVPREQALEKFKEYKNVLAAKRLDEDKDLQRRYRAAAEYPLLDVAVALKETGLNDKQLPKLALARGHWKRLYYSRYKNAFSSSPRYWDRRYAIKLPTDTYPSTGWREGFVDVPHIPPHLRPEDDIRRYHILFEVQNWQEYPRDPLLLKQISGWIFAVIGEWDLSPLEAMLLTGLKAR